MGVGTFFYGIYLVLFCICIYILMKRPRDLANAILLLTAIALFTSATVQIIFNVIVNASGFGALDIPPESIDRVIDGASVMYILSNLVADGLVIYRCYVLWSNNTLVIILPILMLIASTVLGLGSRLGLPALSSVVFFAVSLATNVLVTALTGKD
ncbi:hypothetical protein C8R45DRAFT_1158313 [Mycena sanguinolenta]|nr:hypothetical protein C8R45DRAFT_1158313 [Mycena sanguinolenta]